MPIKFSDLFKRALLPLIILWLVICLSLLSKLIDPLHAPFLDLSSNALNIFYWASESGGKYGAPVIALIALLVLSINIRQNTTNRLKHLTLLILVGGVIAGAGAMFNEHVLKENLQVPRPNILWLAGENGEGPLGMRAEQFYQSGDKEVRRGILAKKLMNLESEYQLSANITKHWQLETGYSMPSGHAFSALFFTTFLLMLAITYLTKKQSWCFYPLLMWALLVCYSRPILRVHTPLDISLGSLQGLLLGLIAYLIAVRLISSIIGTRE